MRVTVVVMLAALIGGCAAGGAIHPRAIAVNPNLPAAKQQEDKALCATLAQQKAGDHTSRVAEGGARTGLVGGLVGGGGGAIGGAMSGSPGKGAGWGALILGTAGLIGGAVAEDQRYWKDLNRHYAECLLEKGYQVQTPQ